MPYDVVPGVNPEKKVKAPWTEYLDGDERLVRLVDYTPDGGRLIATSTDGRPILADHLPTKIGLRDAHPEWKLLDFDKSGIGLRISNAAKELIEHLEPRVHQFFPVEIFSYNYDASKWQDVFGDYDPVAKGALVDRKTGDQWFFIICNRLDSIDRMHTVGLNERGIYRPEKLGIEGRLVLRKDAIRNKHIWCERCVGGIYFSDELISAIDAAGLTGLQRNFIHSV
ncbi:MAG: imm11 family protein [Paracoccaceae bacterium]